MANYTKATNFTVKDTLTSGDPNKIVKGTEIDTEFIAIASAIASKSDLASPAFTGIPTAPTALPTTNTSQLATTAFVQSAIGTALTGIIAMWSGSIGTIPTGWVLCDGTNGTPDLRDKFVIGARQDDATVAKTNVTGSLLQTGGSKDAIAVSHTHTATSVVTDPGHGHNITSGHVNTRTNPYFNWVGTGGASVGVTGATVDPNTTGITVATTIASGGSSGTNANLPPFFALAFIMKTA